MTTASAPATPIEHGDPFIRLTKNRIASLSSKNKEILDDLNKLSQKQSQALTAINSQLETISPRLNGGENHIDDLVSGLKFKSRRNSLQQALSSNPRVELTANVNSLGPTQEMQDKNNFMNKTQTILDQDVLSKRSSKPQTTMSTNSTAAATITTTAAAEATTVILRSKESKTDSNGGELDWKYLVEESVNSDSENANDNLNDKDATNAPDTVGRRRGKSNSGLSINTKTLRNSNRRLITPESSDSEFDLANAHIAFSPSLFGSNSNQDSGRVRPRSFSESGAGGGRRQSRPGSLVLMDDVIEEETATGSLSDAELPEIITERFVGNGKPSPKSLAQTDSRKRSSTQKLIDDVMHRRNIEDSSYLDLADDNSSVRSENSFTEELNVLKTRIKKLENQRTAIEIESVNGKRPTRRRQNGEVVPPNVISPGGSSQGGASTSTTSSRHSMAAPAQHQKHLQNAFEYFEKAYAGTKQKPNDATPPPTHSMAMVVYSAQQLNHKLRGLLAQNDLDGQFSERTIKDLLKNSDEQIRSLTECLLALPTLIPQRPSLSRQTSAEREYQYVTRHMQSASEPQHHVNSRPARSVSPNPPINRGDTQDSHLSMDYHIEHSTQRTSPIPPTDQPSPPHSIYGGSRNSRQNNNQPSLPTSPRLVPDYINDAQSTVTRTFDYRELRNRRFSSGSHASFSGTLPSSSPSPPPNTLSSQISHQYDSNVLNSKPFLERRFSHRYSLSSSNNGYTNTAPPSIASRTTPRVINGYTRSEESSPNPLHHPSPIPLQTTSRNYAPRSNGDEFASNNGVISRTQTPRIYSRRSQYEGAPPQIERRFSPALERLERRSSGSSNISVEYEHGYPGASAYGNHTSEKGQVYRNRNNGIEYDAANVVQGLRRSISNSSSMSYRKLMDIPPEPEIEAENGDGGNGETRENASHTDGDGGTLEGSEGDENAGSGENNGYI